MRRSGFAEPAPTAAIVPAGTAAVRRATAAALGAGPVAVLAAGAAPSEPDVERTAASTPTTAMTPTTAAIVVNRGSLRLSRAAATSRPYPSPGAPERAALRGAAVRGLGLH